MNQESAERVYTEIAQLRIELEFDPTVLGTQYINRVISQCRNYLNRISQILLQLSREKRVLKRQLSGEETALSVERDTLMAEDDVVRRQPNIRDREAVANTMLRDRLSRISTLKFELMDVEAVEQAVKMVHQELIRTSAEIKTQRSLMHTDRLTGAGYGDEFSSGDSRDEKGRLIPRRDDIDELDLDQIMKGDPQQILEEEGLSMPEKPPSIEPEESTQEEEEEAQVVEAELQAAFPEVVPKEVAVTEPAKTEEVTPTPEPAVSEDDEALTRFLSDKSSEPEPEKAPKSNGKKKNEDDDFDFESLLSNL
jgi:hypothetical protein